MAIFHSYVCLPEGRMDNFASNGAILKDWYWSDIWLMHQVILTQQNWWSGCAWRVRKRVTIFDRQNSSPVDFWNDAWVSWLSLHWLNRRIHMERMATSILDFSMLFQHLSLQPTQGTLERFGQSTTSVATICWRGNQRGPQRDHHRNCWVLRGARFPLVTKLYSEIPSRYIKITLWLCQNSYI